MFSLHINYSNCSTNSLNLTMKCRNVYFARWYEIPWKYTWLWMRNAMIWILQISRCRCAVWLKHWNTTCLHINNSTHNETLRMRWRKMLILTLILFNVPSNRTCVSMFFGFFYQAVRWTARSVDQNSWIMGLKDVIVAYRVGVLYIADKKG